MLVMALGGAVLANIQQREQVPVFRARTDLVQLYATVRDVNGDPVRGLRPEEFSVFDNDQRVNLEVVAEVAGRDFEGPEWAREHSVNVVSNEPLEGKRLVVIVLDDARMSPRGSFRKHVQDIGREVIRNLAPDDLACVVFTATNQGAQDFTSDRALLLKAVDSLGGGFSGVPMMAAYSMDVVRRATATLAETPARRKMLVFVGTGLPIYVLPPNTSKPVRAPPPGSRMQADAFGEAGRVDALLKAAQKAGIGVYVIDTRERVSGPAGWNPLTSFVNDLARHTGAIAVVGEPDARKAARRIYADAGHYYVLGFRPDETVRPGMYRKVRVTVAQPDVEVRSQTGYYPPKTIVGDLPELKGAPTTAALAGALPTGSLPLQMGLTSFATRSATGGWVGYISVALEGGTAASGSARTSGPVQMELRVFDGEGRREVASVTDRRQILPSGQLAPQPVLELRPGRYNVRLALQHETNKLTSSVYGTVTVPNYATEALSVSDVFVHASDAAANAWHTGVSSVRRSFSRSEQVSLVVGAYVAQKPLTTTVQIVIVNAANEVVHRDSRNVLVGGDKAPSGTEVRVELPLARLGVGPHLATIAMSAGKITLNRNLVFAIR